MDKIYSICGKIIDEFIDTDNIKEICHYTSLNGLKSILKNKSIWFSDLDFLNDTSEMEYGLTMIRKYLDENSNNYDNNFIQKIERLCATNKSDYLKLKEDLNSAYYVMSFTIDEDSLPMWYYYTKDKEHKGCNIKFNKDLLMDSIKNLQNFKENCIFGKVLYDESEQLNIIKKLFDKIYPIYQKENQKNKILSQFVVCLHLLAVFMKTKCFDVEKEYRLVFRTVDKFDKVKVNFRNSNSLIIPYLDLKFCPHSISKITLSPSVQNQILKVGILKLLAEYEYSKNIEIGYSNIPLRY